MEFKLVRVEWDDASCISGWVFLSDLESQTKPELCSSIGWIVRETDAYLVISGHLVDGTKCSDAMIIPKGMIKKIWHVDVKTIQQSVDDVVEEAPKPTEVA